jgi:NADPH-dependent glutamate synthase beta subunit-like oxidoreductase
VEIPRSESILPAGLAVEAIGETVDEGVAAVLGGVELAAGLVKVDPETLATSRTGVFAAGDLVNGGTTVVQALAEGKKAGVAIDRFLRSGE